MESNSGAERYERLFRAFEELHGLTPARREDRLLDLARDDADFAQEVRLLLRSAEQKEDGATPARALAFDDAAWLPEVIGKYSIQDRLGMGGMGVVFEAIQESPRRRVAIKLLHPLQASPERLRRLRQEGETLGKLHHPGIAQILEAGTYDLGQGPQPYFAMELVEGVDLRTHASREGIDLAGQVDLLARVADAIHHAHQRGVVHRDLKPENILVDAYGQPKVLDFGIARSMDPSALMTRMTLDGTLLGTLAYMAPEQLGDNPDEITPRTDIYGLGVVAYELLGGQLPFQLEGLGLPTAIQLLQVGDLTPLGAIDARLRGDVGSIIGKAMERDPGRRYASAAALAADLRRYLRFEPVSARPPGVLYRLGRFVRKQRGVVTAIGLVLLSLSAGLGWALYERGRTQAGLDQVLRLSDAVLLQEAIDEARDLWPADPERIEPLTGWIDRARELVARLPGHEQRLSKLRLGSETGTEAQWHLGLLSGLVDELRSFRAEATGLLPKMEQRLASARSIREQSLTGEEAQRAWAEAIAALASPAASSQYRGLVLTPQLGLLPMGLNALTGLMEFWVIQSGDRPEQNSDWPQSSKSRWRMTDSTGIVLVLIPAGTFRMGAADDDDLARTSERPAGEVALGPFFLSAFELTQGQWLRLHGKNPSYYSPSSEHSRNPVSLAHPVEQVSWHEVERSAWMLGLQLPTEAQWEYACRAGSQSRWHSGAEASSLQGIANVADSGSVASFSAGWQHEASLVDGFDVHAPVGSFEPNAFGLHDMHGNVWEWCRDVYADYGPALQEGDGLQGGDGERPGEDASLRIYRGGSFYFSAARARSSARNRHSSEVRFDGLGVRLARRL